MIWLPGYRFDTSVNGTHTTLTSKSATAKLPINLFVKVLIWADLDTTTNTATFPTTPMIATTLYAMLKIYIFDNEKFDDVKYLGNLNKTNNGLNLHKNNCCCHSIA